MKSPDLLLGCALTVLGLAGLFGVLALTTH